MFTILAMPSVVETIYSETDTDVILSHYVMQTCQGLLIFCKIQRTFSAMKCVSSSKLSLYMQTDMVSASVPDLCILFTSIKDRNFTSLEWGDKSV